MITWNTTIIISMPSMQEENETTKKMFILSLIIRLYIIVSVKIFRCFRKNINYIYVRGTTPCCQVLWVIHHSFETIDLISNVLPTELLALLSGFSPHKIYCTNYHHGRLMYAPHWLSRQEFILLLEILLWFPDLLYIKVSNNLFHSMYSLMSTSCLNRCTVTTSC